MSEPKKTIRVGISIIDSELYLPYQWALLKTFVDDDPSVAPFVEWEKPIHFSTSEIKTILKTNRFSEFGIDFTKLDVLGLSCYTWNTFYQRQLAIFVKQKNPNCLVVAGGPDIPYKKANVFELFPEFDVIVKSDGEIPFRKILSQCIEGRMDFSEIGGLVLPRNGIPVDTGPPEVLKVFHKSPWMHCKTELEESIHNLKEKNEVVRVIFETNRGCPYSCSFCNWGSNTNSKIRLFEMENIKKEIEWFGLSHVEDIMLADANFGILTRDMEITSWLCQLGELSPRPSFFFSPTKNKSQRVIDIATQLNQAGIFKTFVFGVQSTDLQTLAAIGRANMRLIEQRTVVDEITKISTINCVAQLILGCPGETLESWKTSVTDMLEIGITSIVALRFQFLPNAPADDISYRRKWEIKTMWRNSESHEEVRDFKVELIQSCLTFSESEHVEMTLFLYMVQIFANTRLLRNFVGELRKNFQISYRGFFDDLFSEFFGSPIYPHAYDSMERQRMYLRDFISSGPLDEVFPFVELDVGGKKAFVRGNRVLELRIKQDQLRIQSEFSEYIKIKYPYFFVNEAFYSETSLR